MCRCKIPIIFILFLALSLMPVTPVTLVSAASLPDVLPQLSSDTSSGSGLVNIILGLLVGKLLGNTANNDLSGIAKTQEETTTSAASVNSSGPNIVNTAQKYMGVPYVWGGETPSGWDCSGFTRYVMKRTALISHAPPPSSLQ